MVKPRAKIERGGFSPGLTQFVEVDLDELHIAAWCPDDKAQLSPEQVHVVQKIKGLEDMPIILRFKSPDTLGFLIEELARYRREVWPDAEPLDLEDDLRTENARLRAALEACEADNRRMKEAMLRSQIG